MKLNDYFNLFHGNIALNPTRVDKIETAFNTWDDLLRNDSEIKDLFKDFFKQGSYATKTCIRPQNDGEYDIDTVLLMDIEDDKGAKEVIKFLADRLKSHEAYKDKIVPRDRCVRVNYVGEFHFDIVPAKPTDGEYILIPSKSEDSWVETNPIGYKNWCTERDTETNGKFSRITKMIKYWRDNNVGQDTAPKSIVLTTIIGSNVKGYNSDAETLVVTLENMVNNIDTYLKDDEPYVENPTLQGENLARDWDKDSFEIFKRKLIKFASKAREALEEEDKDKSIKLWQDIFGSKFPSTLPEAANMSQNIKNGNVFVSSAGVLNNETGRQIQEHRFYGGESIV